MFRAERPAAVAGLDRKRLVTTCVPSANTTSVFSPVLRPRVAASIARSALDPGWTVTVRPNPPTAQSSPAAAHTTAFSIVMSLFSFNLRPYFRHSSL